MTSTWRVDLCIGWQRVATCDAFTFAGTLRCNAPGEFDLSTSPAGIPPAGVSDGVGGFEPFDPRDIDTIRLVIDGRLAFPGYVQQDDGGLRIERTAEGERWRWTGVDAWWLLSRRLVFPDPSVESMWLVSHDVRSGVASTVLAGYLNDNIGPTALASRVIPGVQVIDEDIGPDVMISAQPPETLDALAQRVAAASGFVVVPEVEFDGTVSFRLSAPRDLSNLVVLSDKGDLLSSEARFRRTEATWVLAGGAGEGTGQLFRIADEGSTGAARLEQFIDAQSMTNASEVQAQADAALELLADTQAVSTELTDATTSLAIAFGLRAGDYLGVMLRGRKYRLPIDAVSFEASAERQVMRPKLGVAESNDLGALIRSAESSSTLSTLLGTSRRSSTSPATQNGGSVFYPEAFGAYANGTADDTEAITTAIAAAAANGGGTVVFAARDYRTTSTLTLSTPGIVLRGAGEWGHLTAHTSSPTRIIADFNGSEAIRVTAESVTIENLSVEASTTRAAASANSVDIGIRAEATDIVGGATKRLAMRQVRVTGHPSHGVVLVNDVASSMLELVSVDNCKGHGIAIAGGTWSSRTNLTRPGQVDLLNCRGTRCTGHSLYVGLGETVTNDVPYRINVDNFESFFCATDGAVRVSAHQAIVSGENHRIVGCAFEGTNGAGTAITIPLLVRGNSILVSVCRLLQGATSAVEVGDHSIVGTDDTRISQVEFINTIGSYNPAIAVSSAATRFTLDGWSGTATTLTDVGVTAAGYEVAEAAYTDINLPNVFRRGIASRPIPFTMADDTAAYIQFSAGAIGLIAWAGNIAGAGSALVAFRVGSSGAAQILTNPGAGGPTVTGGTGTLAGTTGTDTHLTFRGDTATNRLYIENRTGSSRSYWYTLLSAGGLSGYGTAVTVADIVAV